VLRTYEQHSRIKLVTTIVAIVVIAGMVFVVDHLKSEQAESMSFRTAPSSTTTVPTTPATNPVSSGAGSTSSSNSTPTSGYKDGTYTATSDYYVPHGQEEIQVKLSLQGGTITTVSIQNSENDFTSAQYQEEFAAEYKNYVVGKKINSVQLSFVAGASDTTQAFDDALNKIASQAQV